MTKMTKIIRGFKSAAAFGEIGLPLDPVDITKRSLYRCRKPGFRRKRWDYRGT